MPPTTPPTAPPPANPLANTSTVARPTATTDADQPTRLLSTTGLTVILAVAVLAALAGVRIDRWWARSRDQISWQTRRFGRFLLTVFAVIGIFWIITRIA